MHGLPFTEQNRTQSQEAVLQAYCWKEDHSRCWFQYRPKQK